MADMKAGVTTTEFWGTVLVHLLAFTTVVLGFFAQHPAVQIALSVIGVVSSLLKQLGYESKRVELKTASAASTALVVPFPPKAP